MEKNQSFAAERIHSVRVRLTWAQLEIIKGGQDAFHVHIVGHDDSADEIRVEEKNNALIISQPQYTAAAGMISLKRWIQVCVRVPDGWIGEMDASTVSGPINAHKVHGDDLAFSTVSGSIHAASINGSHVGLRSISGAIAGEGIKTQHLFLRAVSGRVKLTDIQSATTKVFTVSGKISLQLGDECKSIDLQSISGDVQLSLKGSVKETSLRSLIGQYHLDDELIKSEDGLDITSMSVTGSLTVAAAEART
jgi:DUF4097 and DUF4098 domain-containing protein YvlB